MRGFETYTLEHVDEVTKTVQGLAEQLRVQESVADQRMTNLGASIQRLVLEIAEVSSSLSFDRRDVGQSVRDLSQSWADSIDSKIAGVQKQLMDLQVAMKPLSAASSLDPRQARITQPPPESGEKPLATSFQAASSTTSTLVTSPAQGMLTAEHRRMDEQLERVLSNHVRTV